MSNIPPSPAAYDPDLGENDSHAHFVSDSEQSSLSSTPTPSTVHRSLAQQPTSGSYFSSVSPSSTYTSASASTPGRPPILMRSSSAHSVQSRRGMRSTSVSSTTARGFRDDEPLSEADEDEDGGTQRDNRSSRRATSDVAEDDEHVREDEEDSDDQTDADPITLKERQSLINVEHPFGLPIWKPALYKKSRSVTRYADATLHSIPSAQVEKHLLPGNLFWVVFFGWWLSLVCFGASAVVGLVEALEARGRKYEYQYGYAKVLWGLGWYIAWPFGKYVEGDVDSADTEENAEELEDGDQESSRSTDTVRGHQQSNSWISNPNSNPTEHTSLLNSIPSKSYGASSPSPGAVSVTPSVGLVTKAAFLLLFTCLIAPLMLLVSLVCWFLVLTIPMAKLCWEVVKHVWEQPESIRFCAAPVAVLPASVAEAEEEEGHEQHQQQTSEASAASTSASGSTTEPPLIPRLTKGQPAPSTSPLRARTVLLCTYRATGLKFYKYTVGGVNIMFVNLIFVVFFAIIDWALLLPHLEDLEAHHKPIPWLLAAVASQGTIFVLSLLSVIPLSYFIGMAVASISAQSSIGMGAVINATFGSIIEILLYSIALDRGKGRLVEGSIVGSLLAGVLLMPGMSMVSSAMRRKEQRYNAKSAGVTSMMLIMAIIGALAPTLFYQTYGNFQLVCSGCPSDATSTPNPLDNQGHWTCDRCYYQHPDPVHDPFYQSTVKSLMFFCSGVLIFSYLVGLWFSLRTHASQIWQNPQQLLNPIDPQASLHLPLHLPNPHLSNSHQQSFYQKLVPVTVRTLSHRASNLALGRSQSPPVTPTGRRPGSPLFQRRVSYATAPAPSAASSTPGTSAPTSAIPATPGILESVDHAVKNSTITSDGSLQLPETTGNAGTDTTLNLTREDFTRAVAVATVSALRHQQQAGHVPARLRGASNAGQGHISIAMDPGHSAGGHGGDGGGHGGHDAPSWSRFTSASVLLACTALYAVIAEILVDVIDVILNPGLEEKSGLFSVLAEKAGVDEKFLGVTLLALVPNTTEFMNAISFALNGNIALSMEIGSAYALQVCLLQIPAMVAFSAWWFPDRMGEVAHTFSLIFPRWDVIAIILSMFLLTYTYIEAKSNYHRGSILILSYLVLIAGFYYAPRAEEDHQEIGPSYLNSSVQVSNFELTFWEYVRWYLTSKA